MSEAQQGPLGLRLQDSGVAAGASGSETSGWGPWLESPGILGRSGTLGVSSLWSWVP